VLFLTGANDPRVDPMQSRKMTARLQAANPGGVVLLRTSASSGHGLYPRSRRKSALRVVAAEGSAATTPAGKGPQFKASVLRGEGREIGGTLVWDPASHDVVGDPEATSLLRRPYRQPWVHPEPAHV
jgi:hypothetical protein